MNTTHKIKLVGNAKRDASIKAAHEKMLATRYGINSNEYRRITSKR